MLTAKPVIDPDEFTWTYSRSGGPGGQNVNKVSSRATLRWSVLDSSSLSDDVKARFIDKFTSRLTSQGEILISSDQFRDQGRNAADCIEKLEAMIHQVLHPPKKRRPTKPTRASKRRRVETKRKRSEHKKLRGRVDW